MAYVEKVPEKFGQLGRLSGLYFGCTGCARGTLFTATELVRLYGTEGRVADLAEAAELTATNVDALVVRIVKLKPKATIS